MSRSCLHCGENVFDAKEEFCCLGCATAYKIVTKFGFENYYKLREINSEVRKIKPEMEEEVNISEFVVGAEDGSNSVSLIVQGLHCAACVWLIESILKKQKNVLKARINLSKKTLFLQWQGSVESGNDLVHLIHEIGYKLLPFDAEILNSADKKYSDSILRAMAVAGFGAGNIMLFSFSLWFANEMEMGKEVRNLLHFFSSLIALPVVVFSARPFFSSALKSIRGGYPNMDLAISIAIFLACVVSVLQTFRGAEHVYFDSAVMLTFFLLIGRYLDLKARKKAFTIASEFTLLAASFGRVEQDSKIKILPIKQLKEGMILLVAAGEKIAADGVVVEGESEIDNSLITGETLPKQVAGGSEVFAGTINLNSALKIKITKSAQNSLLSQIISLSEEAESKKIHYVRISDYLSKFYTPAVHILALGTFLFWLKSGWEVALMNATAVLIITCPCALALAVPIVQTIVISGLIKKGILVKSGEALEKLREIEVIVFDKTGSLTEGSPRLTEIFLLKENQKISLSPQQKNHFLKLAASLSKASNHPLSKAISESYSGELEDFLVQESRGFGLESGSLKLGRRDFCEVKNRCEFDEKFLRTCPESRCDELDTLIRENRIEAYQDIREKRKRSESDVDGHRSRDYEQVLTCFAKFGEDELIFLFEDKLKEDAEAAIVNLKKLGKKIILLSGDVEEVVKKVAQDLAISEFYFEQTPVFKVQFLEKLKAENKKFVMIGDGLNDAPALALADVSISFSKAVDISQNIADVVISSQKLMPIVELNKLSSKAILLMRQNLLLALVYNLIAVPYAILGHVVPLVAAIAMSSSSLLVLVNSLRISSKK